MSGVGDALVDAHHSLDAASAANWRAWGIIHYGAWWLEFLHRYWGDHGGRGSVLFLRAILMTNLLVVFWLGEKNVGVLSATDEDFVNQLREWARDKGYRTSTKRQKVSERDES